MSTPLLDPSTVTARPLSTGPASGLSRAEWLNLARWARWLSWVSLAYMAVEGAVAIAAGVVSGSIALLGFGIDSAIEGFASLVIVWRFTGARLLSDHAEQRAQRLVAVQFFILAPYITVVAIHDLAAGERPDASWVGIALAASSIALMPLLGVAKQRIGRRMGSVATQGEGAQNLLCAYMAAALLVGLAGNALFGLWWLDPVAALAIAALAVREGIEAWRGESCCLPGAGGDESHRTDECCSPPRSDEPLAIAQCRLDSAGLRTQADRYRRLGTTATRIERREGFLSATFGPALDERLLHETISIEGECCAFFDLDYQPADRRLSIGVAQSDQEPALDALHFALTGHEATDRPAAPLIPDALNDPSAAPLPGPPPAAAELEGAGPRNDDPR
jgi:hypothetical protein